MDTDNEIIIARILQGIAESGPVINFDATDVEALRISTKSGVAQEAVYPIKYLAENGPPYDEMLDNAWNVVFASESANDRTEEADDTICPYEGCGGYESEFSHVDQCPYTLSLRLMEEWRQVDA